MTSLPTPAMVPAGHVVRVIVPHRTYTSPVLSPAQAAAEKARIDQALRDVAGSTGMFGFETHDGWLVSIRGRAVTAVECGPPPAWQEKPTPPAPVHVHVHMTADTADEVTEKAAGVVPTPLALAGRRRP